VHNNFKKLAWPSLAFFCASTAVAETRLPTFNWVANDQCASGIACCGRFVQPTPSHSFANLDPLEAPTTIRAEDLNDIENVLTLQGNVRLEQGWRSAAADKATLDRDTEIATLTGNIHIEQPSWAVSGDMATINIADETSVIHNGKFVLYNLNANGAAQRVAFSGDNLNLDQMVFTTCEPINPGWTLQGESLQIDQEKGQGTGKNISLKVKDTTVFWWPYLKFPVGDKRLSGFLWPRIGYSDTDGFEYAQPYYFNLAPDYDATVTPHLFTERGLLVSGEFRHLSRHSYTEIASGYLYDDKVEDDDRWLRKLYHQGTWGNGFSTYTDWTETSDANYLRDLGDEGLSIGNQPNLAQYAKLAYTSKHWQMAIASEHYQPLHINSREGHRISPQVNLDGNYRWSLGNHYGQLTLNSEHATFTHDNGLDQIMLYGLAPTGERYYGNYQVEVGRNHGWGHYKVGLRSRHLGFKTDNLGLAFAAESDANQTSGYFEAGAVFAKDVNLLSERYHHTLEPRLYYYNTPYAELDHSPVYNSTLRSQSFESLFSDRRIAGYDRIDDGERYSLGVTARLLSSNGLEKLRFSIGQGFYNGNRYAALNPLLNKAVIDAGRGSNLTSDALNELHQLTRDRTNIETELSTQLNKRWQFIAALGYDTERSTSEHANLMAWYRGKRHQFVSMSAAYKKMPSSRDQISGAWRDRDTSQASLGTVWPISGQYKLIANVTHDFTNSRLLEGLVAVSYESCCWQASIGYRQWVNNRLNTEVELQELKRGIVLQFSLTGLGGTGQIDNALYKSMYGYEQNYKDPF